MKEQEFAIVDLESTDLLAGGTQHYVELARALQQRGVHLSFVGRPSLLDFLRKKFPNADTIERDPRPLVDLTSLFSGFSDGRRSGASAVISTSPYFNTFFYSLGFSLAKSRPLIVMMHHKQRLRARVRFLGAYGLASYLFYLPARLSHYLPNVHALYNGTIPLRRPREYPYIMSRADIPCEGGKGIVKDVDVCFLGRMSKLKGFHEFIEVCEAVRREVPGLRVVAMGKKMELPVPEWIEHLGVVDEEKKYETLSRSKVFLFPSHEEGFSISTLEAMCKGAVPVLWDIPGYPFKNVVRVKEGDVAAASKAVIGLLKDGVKREAMSKAAAEEAKKYTSIARIEEEAKLIAEVAGLAI
ncbi:MAG: glycosyltransferase family 4 protein [Thermoprotei archaeon]